MMKKNRFTSLLFGTFIVLASPLALADNPPPSGSVPISSVVKNLETQGYSAIRKIEFEDNVYQVEALNKRGDELKLRIDPQSGKIVSPNENEAANASLSMLDLVNKIEKSGYHSIYKVECESKKCEVKALTKDGKKVELKVDVKTGAILKTSED